MHLLAHVLNYPPVLTRSCLSALVFLWLALAPAEAGGQQQQDDPGRLDGELGR
jgi:hypothetical protein